MEMTLNVQLPVPILQALYNALMTPTKDREDHTVYTVNVTLAGEVRLALADAMAVMK